MQALCIENLNSFPEQTTPPPADHRKVGIDDLRRIVAYHLDQFLETTDGREGEGG